MVSEETVAVDSMVVDMIIMVVVMGKKKLKHSKKNISNKGALLIINNWEFSSYGNFTY